MAALNPAHAEAVLAHLASPFPPGLVAQVSAETASTHYHELAAHAGRMGFLDTAMRYLRMAEALCPSGPQVHG